MYLYGSKYSILMNYYDHNHNLNINNLRSISNCQWLNILPNQKVNQKRTKLLTLNLVNRVFTFHLRSIKEGANRWHEAGQLTFDSATARRGEELWAMEVHPTHTNSLGQDRKKYTTLVSENSFYCSVMPTLSYLCSNSPRRTGLQLNVRLYYKNPNISSPHSSISL